jgi:hypothetical protein
MRLQENRRLEAEDRQRKAEVNRAIVQRYGGGDLKLLMFYANPPQVAAGGKSLLCYGVANASTVTIEPAVQGVSPSLSRCVEVRPTESITYTLIATGGSGSKATREVKVTVR